MTTKKTIGSAYPPKWNAIAWNPPVHRSATSAFTRTAGDDDLAGSANRDLILGDTNYANRLFRKGVIFQDWTYAADWGMDDSTGVTDYTVKKNASALGNQRYGFRFHYNPSTVNFFMGVSTNVNAAVIASTAASARPITSDGSNPTIGLTLFLNRIEDMRFLGTSTKYTVSADASRRYREAVAGWEQRRIAALTAGRRFTEKMPLRRDFPNLTPQFANEQAAEQYFYGGNGLTDEQRTGILTRGTGYDLEYLFRTVLGRPYNSILRGKTADIGIAFGVPLILDLSAGKTPVTSRPAMRYRGRLDNISYTHLSFTRDMVPMWTQVDLSFTRWPDVIDSGVKGPAPAPTAAQKADVGQQVLDSMWNGSGYDIGVDGMQLNLTQPEVPVP